MLYNPKNYNNSWAFSEVATRLFRNMMENEDLLQMFIDKCCVYMGDFLNGKGTSETIDLIMAEAMDEFVAHRDKYNGGGGWGGWGGWGQPDNRRDIENKFNNAKTWAEGRPNNFYKYIGNKWNLGTAVPVTINKDITDMPDSVAVNDIALSEGVFDGKLFPNRQYVIAGTAPEGKVIKGWKVVATPKSGAKVETTSEGSELKLTIDANTKSLSIEAILDNETGISTASAQAKWQWKRTVGGFNVSEVPAGEKVSLYDLRGVQLSEVISNGSNIFLPAASGQLYILKVGSESVKIQ
jgi:hypothetical protein